MKAAIAELRAIQVKLALLEKDIEAINKWKEDQKKEREEGARRFWAFGPSLVSAIISAIVSGSLFFLARWLNQPK